jgi:hypothetical protein
MKAGSLEYFDALQARNTYFVISFILVMSFMKSDSK